MEAAGSAAQPRCVLLFEAPAVPSLMWRATSDSVSPAAARPSPNPAQPECFWRWVGCGIGGIETYLRGAVNYGSVGPEVWGWWLEPTRDRIQKTALEELHRLILKTRNEFPQ